MYDIRFHYICDLVYYSYCHLFYDDYHDGNSNKMELLRKFQEYSQ